MRDPQALIGTEQLSTILGQPSLRVYDCTTYLEPPPPGMLRSLGFAAGDLPGHAAPGLLRRQARGAGRNQGYGHRDRQRPGTPVPEGPGTEPVRPTGPGPGQRQRPGSDAGDPVREDFTDLFLPHQLGHDALTRYDGSMGEWAKDPSLPIETD